MVACRHPLDRTGVPATPVVMADGTTKKIKDVKVGDKVLATDPESGKTSARTVTALHVYQDTELTDLSVAVILDHRQRTRGS
jgi:Pretoxin HINT domain